MELPAPTIWDHASVFPLPGAFRIQYPISKGTWALICLPCQTCRKMMCAFVAPQTGCHSQQKPLVGLSPHVCAPEGLLSPIIHGKR